MAKYKVTYGCGCTQVVNILGPADVRLKKMEALKGDLCNDCKHKKAVAYACEHNLPRLYGSPKQTAWAETIRMEGFVIYNMVKEQLIGRCDLETLNQMMMETNAGWWIANRHHFSCVNSFIIFAGCLVLAQPAPTYTRY